MKQLDMLAVLEQALHAHPVSRVGSWPLSMVVVSGAHNAKQVRAQALKQALLDGCSAAHGAFYPRTQLTLGAAQVMAGEYSWAPALWPPSTRVMLDLESITHATGDTHK
jgi:hypothetical protein